MPRGFLGVDDDDDIDPLKAELIAAMSGSSIQMARTASWGDADDVPTRHEVTKGVLSALGANVSSHSVTIGTPSHPLAKSLASPSAFTDTAPLPQKNNGHFTPPQTVSRSGSAHSFNSVPHSVEHHDQRASHATPPSHLRGGMDSGSPRASAPSCDTTNATSPGSPSPTTVLTRDNKGIWGGSKGSSLSLSQKLEAKNNAARSSVSSIEQTRAASKASVASRESQQSARLGDSATEDKDRLSDDVTIADLLHSLSSEFNWSPEEVEEDIAYLHAQRIRTIRHLRLLSDASWKELKGIPMIVRDAIRYFASQ